MAINLAVVKPARKPKMSDAEYYELRKKIKAELAEERDSILWIPFSGKKGRTAAKLIRKIDSEITFKRTLAGGALSVSEIQEYVQKIQTTAVEVWDIVSYLIPQMHCITIKNFRRLNNDKTIKQMHAKDPKSEAVMPKSEEVSFLAMAVKQIEEKGVALQQGQMEELEELKLELLPKYDTVLGKIRALDAELSKNIPQKKQAVRQAI